MDLGARNAVATVIRRNRPWKGLGDVEFAMLDWVCWYNERRLMEPTATFLQSSLNQCMIRINRPASSRPDSTKTVSGIPGTVHNERGRSWEQRFRWMSVA